MARAYSCGEDGGSARRGQEILLPSTAELLLDPERFLRSLARGMLVLDELHQLPDPIF